MGDIVGVALYTYLYELNEWRWWCWRKIVFGFYVSAFICVMQALINEN